MNDSRLPKAVFYGGGVTKGKRFHGGQRLRYKCVVKIKKITRETLIQDRQQWMQANHEGYSHIEENISQNDQHDQNPRQGLPNACAPTVFCTNFGRGFAAPIRLISHQRAKHMDETLQLM